MDKNTSTEVDRLCRAGEACFEECNFRAALSYYENAWDLLPEPREQCENALWLLGSIGDSHFLLGEFEKAYGALKLAMYCPGGIGNPFLHLRLGQCNFELGDFERATVELTRALMADGLKPFEGEDPKYLDSLAKALNFDLKLSIDPGEYR